MFDRSLLPEALFEFVVISDTHYLERGGGAIFEFQSQLEEYRVETALRMVASLEPLLVIYLGDLTMAIPEREGFAQAMAAALEQMKRRGVEAYHVAGNHDVGDKPDPIMPAPSVQAESLEWYHAKFGQSWYSFDHLGGHFVVLNAQLMNSTLPDAEYQREWLERDLATCAGDRTFMFLHMPPYLWDEHEPALGNYEIIDEPGRSWLLDIVRNYQVELLVTGHVHFAFFDRLAATRYFVLSSPSFTRGEFSYLFADCPPEHGQNDAPKLGFYLFRVYPNRTDVHFIRTGGAISLSNTDPDSPQRLITRTSAELANSPLGVTLRYPLAPSTETPIGRKSVIRRRVRNDYPLLACMELGVKHIRVPWTDLRDPLQSRRLAIARDEGIQITATSIWTDALDLPTMFGRHLDQVDCWEVQVPGTPWPSVDCLHALKQCRAKFQMPIALSAIVPKQVVRGKRYRATRVGYQLDELVDLNRRLAEEHTEVERILCRIDVDTSPWELVCDMRRLPPFSNIGTVDLALGLQIHDQQNANRVAEAAFAMVLLPGSYIFFEPLVDLKRVIDVNHGLLDSMCNPRTAFDVLRCLNTILCSSLEKVPEFQPAETLTPNAQIRTVVGSEMALSLLLPKDAGQELHQASQHDILSDTPGDVTVTVYWLHEGTSWTTTLALARRAIEASNVLGPTLVVRQRLPD